MTRFVRSGNLGPGKCRTCGARIVWALNDHGSRVPIDAQADVEGNQVLWYDDPPDDENQRASTVASFELQTGKTYSGPTHRSHFATCSGAYAPVPELGAQLQLIPGGKR